jgi:hypothetical protein
MASTLYLSSKPTLTLPFSNLLFRFPELSHFLKLSISYLLRWKNKADLYGIYLWKCNINQEFVSKHNIPEVLGCIHWYKLSNVSHEHTAIYRVEMYANETTKKIANKRIKLPELMLFLVGFVVLTAIIMKSYICWDVMQCSPLKMNQSFNGICRIWNVRWISSDYMSLYPRKWNSSCGLLSV